MLDKEIMRYIEGVVDDGFNDDLVVDEIIEEKIETKECEIEECEIEDKQEMKKCPICGKKFIVLNYLSKSYVYQTHNTIDGVCKKRFYCGYTCFKVHQKKLMEKKQRKIDKELGLCT